MEHPSRAATLASPLRSRQGVPAPGERVAGKYVVDRVLGVGGMGAVAQARNELTGRDVALKWLHESEAEGQRTRFLREALAAGRVRHPNVVDVFDVVDDPARGLLLVMELLEGETLAARIARSAPLAEREAIAIARDVARALDAAHRAGVVHRDLKPSNVFLADEDGAVVVKVLDFGVARLIDATELERVTRSGQIVGTPHYMAPEQVLGAEDIGARADVYALGAVLYEMLTGGPPHDHEVISALFVAIATEPIAPLIERAAHVSPALDALDGRMLAKNPADRPSAAQLVAELDALLATPAPELERAPAEPVARASAPEDAHPEDEHPAPVPRHGAPARARSVALLAVALACAAIALGLLAHAARAPSDASDERIAEPASPSDTAGTASLASASPPPAESDGEPASDGDATGAPASPTDVVDPPTPRARSARSTALAREVHAGSAPGVVLPEAEHEPDAPITPVADQRAADPEPLPDEPTGAPRAGRLRLDDL